MYMYIIKIDFWYTYIYILSIHIQTGVGSSEIPTAIQKLRSDDFFRLDTSSGNWFGRFTVFFFHPFFLTGRQPFLKKVNLTASFHFV